MSSVTTRAASSRSQFKFDPTRIGKFWDDIEIGEHITDYHHEAVEITQEMIDQFALLTNDLNPIHVDPEYSRGFVHRRPIAHGELLTSLAIGQYYRTGYTYGTTVALLQTQAVYKGRAYPGDLLYLDLIVRDKEKEPHPKRGQVTFDVWLKRREDDEVVIQLQFDAIILRRAGAGMLKRLGVEDIENAGRDWNERWNRRGEAIV